MARRKKKERADELRGMSDDDLSKELQETYRRLFTLRLQLSTRQRLELFIQVCQAVQHAHQKGIIHRDLKVQRQIARIRTLQQERELAAAYSALGQGR